MLTHARRHVDFSLGCVALGLICLRSLSRRYDAGGDKAQFLRTEHRMRLPAQH
jgi:hypothetical protein